MTSAVPAPARGWKEQLRRVGELCLLGIVALLASMPVVTIGAVVATLSTAVGHWADHDDLPAWRAMGAEFRRRLLPGVPVGLVGLLATLVVVQQVAWLRDGVVPGGGMALAAFGLATACLLAVVLLAVPRLADGASWRAALAEGWTALLRAPAAALAALAVTGVAVLLAVTLPGVALVLPALLVLALHAVHRRLVLPRTG
ncbi:hypothetical protein [Pseudonocardia kunmingensis]|uniref:Uncharacterized protein n=1 Tax=Pseudonocardia kunmingensis TaxID=630975 RepID=A0A543D576_9PSEU|nr:hypothetical protein [Pseudonocardia kunmingensis]TQM04378.1 hypothetical protein FB558_7413 [Pseudonocardia kunmingensis]